MIQFKNRKTGEIKTAFSLREEGEKTYVKFSKDGKEYENILLQEYGISDIEQLIGHYRCKMEISIFCVPWDNTGQMNRKLALSMVV